MDPNPFPNTIFSEYRHRRSYLNSPTPQRQEWPVGKPNTVYLFKYVKEKFSDPVRPYSWWSEFETGWSDCAGEATGIFDSDCQYRIEWHCPLEFALENVFVGNKRLCSAGAFYEYKNLVSVPQSELKWHKMNDWGVFPK